MTHQWINVVYKSVKSTFFSGKNTEILDVMPSKLHLFCRTQNGVVHGKHAHANGKACILTSETVQKKRIDMCSEIVHCEDI